MNGESRDRLSPAPEEGPLEVIYEDRWMLALNKPAGLVVHPTYKHPSGTLLNAVLWRFRGHTGARPGILTRLDKDTSGLVLVGVEPGIHAAMQRDAAAGLVRKEYLAIVQGVPSPPRGAVIKPLARSPADRRIVVVAPGGAHSETRYEVLAARDGVSLVRCELVTGRTHQIRVHLASSGWPVIGDRTYGSPDARIPRQALHAWRVSLPHPVTREPLTLTAPLPDDMRQLESVLRER